MRIECSQKRQVSCKAAGLSPRVHRPLFLVLPIGKEQFGVPAEPERRDRQGPQPDSPSTPPLNGSRRQYVTCPAFPSMYCLVDEVDDRLYEPPNSLLSDGPPCHTRSNRQYISVRNSVYLGELVVIEPGCAAFHFLDELPASIYINAKKMHSFLKLQGSS